MPGRSVRALGEIGLIARLARRLPRGASVVRGIGDDAAVLAAPAPGERLLFASDMLVEGVHFRLGRTRARDIGWKALASNVSDIAAMGGVPRWAVVSLAVPPSASLAFVDGVYAGLARCARRFGMAIVGGDMSRAPRVVIDVAILGTAPRQDVVLRSGARPGDALFVTGRLGGSYASGRHARFMPRVREARALVRRVRVHAMMDLSDGLATDARHMSRASRAVLRLDAARVPVSRGCSLRQALTDGEDFELLFAVSRADAARVPARLGQVPVTRIGSVVRRGVGVELERDGRIEILRAKGFAHF
jgi:thiamine-monophosphate kinase